MEGINDLNTGDSGDINITCYSTPSAIERIINHLIRSRYVLDDFNLEVAELRVKKGMSDDFIQIYKLMGNFSRKVHDLITDAEIISERYSKLKED